MDIEKEKYSIGVVTKITNCILEVKGLDEIVFNEKVEIKDTARGYVTAIYSSYVEVTLLKVFKPIQIGDEVFPCKDIMDVLYSPHSFGHIIDIYGYDLLANKRLADTTSLKLEYKNVEIMDRSQVCRPLYTGIAGIDLIYPIGKGQRQLILGEKKTGKTQITLDTIVNQKGKDVLCIYIALGKPKRKIREIYQELVLKNAMEYTLILCGSLHDSIAVESLLPYAGLSIAHYHMMQGKDVLVVIDDLKYHANCCREVALMAGQLPGRDIYPTDIFYTHSRLLEKGCQHKNGGSITILPIAETSGTDITDCISTNIISITDGQIVLTRKNFEKGFKPAIEYGLSVSRLGGDVQKKEVKKIGAVVRRDLLSYLEKREMFEFANIDELGESLQKQLKSGEKLIEKLKQYKYQPIGIDELLERFSQYD